jgi:hypothetical protein
MTKTRSLYRNVLGLAVAAIVAAALPFSLMYVQAMTNRAVVTWHSGHAVITTKTSGGQTTSIVAGRPAAQSIPVSTHSS